jgi:hypothetical protein
LEKQTFSKHDMAARLSPHHPHVGYFAHAAPTAVVVARGMGRIEIVPAAPRCWWTSPGTLDRTNPYVGYLAHSTKTRDVFAHGT